MSDQPKCPEPPEFQKMLDNNADAVIKAIFRSFAETKCERVRDMVEDYELLNLQPLIGPVIAFYVKSTGSSFYQLGCRLGMLNSLLVSSELGERMIVTKHDKAGRILETVKLPLTVLERLALETQGGPA